MIYLGADHNGYFLKERLKRFLTKRRLEWFDCGADQFVKTDDYVDYAESVGKRIKSTDSGILVCGSGHGMVIAANKFKGIRAIMPLDQRSARFGKRDDHANVLVLAAWQMSEAAAERITAAFFGEKPGTATRYLRRLAKVKKLER